MINTLIVDIETKDPNLHKLGDGSIRRDGRVLGVGLKCDDRPEWNGYFDVHDPIVSQALASDIDKVFHNGVYDLSWLCCAHKMQVNGAIHDTMTNEYLLDAYAHEYNLDACCQRREIVGKNKADTIDAWWAQQGLKGKAIEHLDEVPQELRAKYCIQDLNATAALYDAQLPILAQENLLEAEKMESELYPLLIQMKNNGIRFDWEWREQLETQFQQEYDQGIRLLQAKYPWLDSIQSSAQIKKAFDAEGLSYVCTEKGNPSFTEDSMQGIDHPLPRSIIRLRHVKTAMSRYIYGLVDYVHRGRLHPTFYPTLRDDGGTITGRMSCKDPNVQAISGREAKFAREIRSLFIPDEGCVLGAFDYKQIEYMIFAHFATGPGAEEIKRRIIEDEKIDFHQMAMNMCGWEGKDGRNLAKNLGFGVIYGLGVRGFSEKFHLTQEYAANKMSEYRTKLPWVQTTVKSIQTVAERRGYVRTLAGKRQRLPPDNKVYKIVNYLIQGSASDILKLGLIKAWQHGVFESLKLHMLIHDEIVFSAPPTRVAREAVAQLKEDMCSAVELSIPIRVDAEIGPNWASCDAKGYERYLAAQ